MLTKSKLVLVALLVAPTIALAQATKKPAPKPSGGQTQPSIVLVHGAWADGSSWDKVVPLLEAKGYNVVAVHLPLTSTADDVAATTRAIEKMPGDVVLVGHSYGGFVITKAGNHDKVKSLVYVDAFGLDEGESVSALLKASPPPWLESLQVDSGGFAWMPFENITKDFVPDLPAAEQKLVMAKQGPVPVKGFDEKMTTPAWKTKPSWYLRGSGDRIIAPEAQSMFAKRMKATTTSIDSGHVPMLSKPRPVAQVILNAAAAPKTTASR
jgi:pimeloyl-ACP methyl ester carboxylesterase